VLVFVASLSSGLLACGSGSNPDGGMTGGTSSQAGTAGAAQAGNATGGGNAGGSSTGGAGASAGGNPSGGAAAGGMSGGAAGMSGGNAGGNGGSGGTVDPGTLDKFSFFVTSMVMMRKLSGSMDGFGGDLRYGTGDGLTGADKICTEIAESSMPGASAKEWHAFLSTSKVNAKDRIGTGPWYDRLGNLVASDLAHLLQERPSDAADAIKEDLPNETGTPNHRPNVNAPEDDNHHTLTGSDAKGVLYGPTATCLDWTSSLKDNKTTGRPRIGFSWSVRSGQAPRVNWISGQDEGGCGAGITGIASENGPSDGGNPIVGSGGGYGGIYCFAMKP
jgi:hypothetical protein